MIAPVLPAVLPMYRLPVGGGTGLVTPGTTGGALTGTVAVREPCCGQPVAGSWAVVRRRPAGWAAPVSTAAAVCVSCQLGTRSNGRPPASWAISVR